MAILGMLVSCFTTINLLLNRIGRNIAWVLVALMISVILLQVFCRYVLGNALPWPEEAARALMIWMMAMVAGEAYRRGSFVAIDMFLSALPERASSLLKLVLLLVAGAVLVKLTVLGIDFFDRGFRSRAASIHISRAWIYLAMPVCFFTMLLANIELCLRELGCLLGQKQLALSTEVRADAPAE
ncbi:MULTISPECIES: TRAP transporter small permease [Marinomonas]|jgi:TRAP-type C4-dicarboxylate transport system permease small subunit|uniref:TRAP transporter small permease protein n=2 Tax=Marinomonas TaxID=28253 RepID=A0A4R6XBY7_9GAMM|nr:MULTISPECIES: TRAP transporter small permease subunit [Marinomonas]MBJ7550557.1 TRAP transporter small permease [Marinomonas ostreistagni]MEC8080311.1 TRAP transporter small permease subunit [Pseudomonadota bacterium]MEC8483059.1 TRAP transporter small permease subunit [Pseudomonadota bacterium]TDR15639.1 TRAP-type C4-dicarboxylate transport system permease small subunit [Marinomonas communis]